MVLSAPEVSSSTSSVTLTPLVSDPRGQGRTLTWRAETCVDPGIAYGAADCSTSATRTDLGTGTVSGLSSPNYTASVGSLTVPILSVALYGRDSNTQFNGVAQVVFYTVQTQDGQSITAVRRIVISTNPIKNSNPSFTVLNANGSQLTSLPSSTVNSVTTDISNASKEVYSYRQSDGTEETAQEQLTTTFFASEGNFGATRLIDFDSTSYTPPASRPDGRGIVIVVVVRDGRGGEANLVVNL